MTADVARSLQVIRRLLMEQLAEGRKSVEVPSRRRWLQFHLVWNGANPDAYTMSEEEALPKAA